MGTCGIYTVQHRESGKTYVGRSVNIEARWIGHKHDAAFKRTNNPLHNAIRKYGAEAFCWKVLTTVPARLQPLLELQFILDMNTVAPHGYNVGGTEGGFPSRQLVEAMPLCDQLRWKAVMARVALTGHAALREKRKDPAYEVAYRAVKRAASFKREDNIRKRREEDPGYDASMRAGRVSASLLNPASNPAKSTATFKARMLSDPDFAASVKANRTRAAKISWARRRGGEGTDA